MLCVASCLHMFIHTGTYLIAQEAVSGHNIFPVRAKYQKATQRVQIKAVGISR